MMEFKIDTYSGDGNGIFGNTSRIKELMGTKVEIRDLNDLKMLAEDVDTELLLDFKEMKLTIRDYYGD